MPDAKDNLLERIALLRKAHSESLTPMSPQKELLFRRLVIDILEYLLVADTARKEEYLRER